MARYLDLHPWDLTPKDAVALQRSLADRISDEPPSGIRTLAGTDVSFDRSSPLVYAGVVVLSLPDLSVIESKVVASEATFPYVPGLLSFREIPPLLRAWEQLETEPDAVMADGHGYAHPRRMGFACHLGLVLDRPTFGCAKSILVGTYDPPPIEKGRWTPLVHRDEVIGAAVRTRDSVSPVFVSRGHRIDLETAIDLTLATTTTTRIPAPTRLAHHLVNTHRRHKNVAVLPVTTEVP